MVGEVAVRDEMQIRLGGFHFSSKGLIVDGAPTYEEWEGCGEVLSRADKMVHWWIGDWVNYGENRWGEKYAQALDETKFDYQTLRDDAWVARQFDLSRRRDNLSFSHHREVAALPITKQDELLAKAAPVEGESRPRLTRNELRQEVKRAKQDDYKAPALPTVQFGVIYADPPWRYDFAETENREIENQYPTMDVAEICALPVADMAASDAVLFLWATSPKLTEALQVVNAWGFDYRTCMVWVKDKIGMGYYARQRHELLLIAKKGNPAVPEPSNRPDSVIIAPRTQHSVKPPEVYEAIERMYPGGGWVELFARAQRPGWVVWGNQVGA